jgi:hypothetical protein
VTRRISLLFLVALLGVLTCVGIVVGELLGPVAVLVYAAVTAVLLVVGAARARAAQERARREAGRSCTCCTTSQHDAVKVI